MHQICTRLTEPCRLFFLSRREMQIQQSSYCIHLLGFLPYVRWDDIKNSKTYMEHSINETIQSFCKQFWIVAIERFWRQGKGLSLLPRLCTLSGNYGKTTLYWKHKWVQTRKMLKATDQQVPTAATEKILEKEKRDYVQMKSAVNVQLGCNDGVKNHVARWSHKDPCFKVSLASAFHIFWHVT